MTDLPEAIAAAIAVWPPRTMPGGTVASPFARTSTTRNVARARVTALRAALPENTTVLYAMKANGHPDVVAAFAAAADGLEVASGGELRLARVVGARADRVRWAGQDRRRAGSGGRGGRAGADVTVNCESVHEIRRLGRLGGADAVRVALRVNRSNRPRRRRTARRGSPAATP